MKGKRIPLILSVVVSLMLMIIALPQSSVSASPGDLVNPGFETGTFSGWSMGAVSDGVSVVGPDGFTYPPQGYYMARLGKSAINSGIRQPLGPNEIYQDFVASEPALSFVYNIFTWDYLPFNHFEYKLTVVGTGDIIDSYSQSAWGSGTALKSTGWQKVTIDISAYNGQQLRLLFNCGGTSDTQLATWAYIDVGVIMPVEVDSSSLDPGQSMTVTKQVFAPWESTEYADIWWKVTADTGLTVTLTPDVLTSVQGQTTVPFVELVTVANNATLSDPMLKAAVIFYSGNYADPSGATVIGTEEVIIHFPDVQVAKITELAEDADGDGAPGPGDTLKYTVYINNTSSLTAAGVVFSDIPDANTTLVTGSVTKTQGSVIVGNQSGDKLVQVSLGIILPNHTAGVTFKVTINSPVWEYWIANQGTVTGSNFFPVKSDNPYTQQIDDPTAIGIKTSPPFHGPGVSRLGIIILVVLFGGAIAWVMRRRQFSNKLH